MREQGSIHARIYSRLLVLYPAELRRRFGSDMADAFEGLLRDANSKAAISRIWTDAIRELLTVAVPLHLENTRALAMAASALFSSLLAWFFFRSVG